MNEFVPDKFSLGGTNCTEQAKLVRDKNFDHPGRSCYTNGSFQKERQGV